MAPLDTGIVALYLIVVLAWGARHARRAGSSTEEFFVAGRSLPWWLAGTSIVATTFAADTPLAIAGLVATEGIAGNWFWWADVLPAMLAAFLIAHLWRRSGVLTDVELCELRYGGRPAIGLRVFRALYFGVVRNAIVIGWVNLAMLKVLRLAFELDAASSAWVLAGLFALTLAYTLVAGFWGVVITDALQFVLAIAGSILLAAFAVGDVGGIAALVGRLRDQLGPEGAAHTLALVPLEREAFWAFVIYVAVKSWSAGNTEGRATWPSVCSRLATSATRAWPPSGTRSPTSPCAPGPGSWWGWSRWSPTRSSGIPRRATCAPCSTTCRWGCSG